MATLKHAFVNPKADGADTTIVRPIDWNADHTLSAPWATSQGGTGQDFSASSGYVKLTAGTASAASTIPTTDITGLATVATSGSGGDLTGASVTYAKIQNVSATSRFLGRITAGAGSIEELTAANAKTILALTSSDVGLGNVTNNAQTQAAVMPNTAPTNGQIPIGNGSAYVPAAITAGSGISVTNGSGSITIAAATGGSPLYTATADAGPNNSNAETSLIGTGVGSMTTPANYFLAGTVLEIDVMGYVTTPLFPDTLNIKLKAGTTSVGATGATTLTASLTNSVFRLLCQVICRTTGATGGFIINTILEVSGAALAPLEAKILNTTTVALDTTGTLAWDVTATWAAAQVGELIKGTNAVMFSPGGKQVVQQILTVNNAASPKSWVVPSNVSVLFVEAWGPGAGGSGGGGGASTGGTPGGGGGGSAGSSGAYVGVAMPVTPGETLTITVPVGGAGGNGGNGGNNAAGSDGTAGTDAADTTIAGALATITAKGGLATIKTGANTTTGKGGASGAGGAAGTAPDAIAGTGGFGVEFAPVAQQAAGVAAVTNANGGGGGSGGVPGRPPGYFGYLSTAAVAPSGTTGGSSQILTVTDTRGFLASGITTLAGGTGGNGNGTNNGAQGTAVSTYIACGGPGGSGGGGNVSGGIAGNGAGGRQGGPGYVLITYFS